MAQACLARPWCFHSPTLRNGVHAQAGFDDLNDLTLRARRRSGPTCATMHSRRRAVSLRAGPACDRSWVSSQPKRAPAARRFEHPHTVTPPIACTFEPPCLKVACGCPSVLALNLSSQTDPSLPVGDAHRRVRPRLRPLAATILAHLTDATLTDIDATLTPT